LNERTSNVMVESVTNNNDISLIIQSTTTSTYCDQNMVMSVVFHDNENEFNDGPSNVSLLYVIY
jgi:hypothetical protein